MCNKPWVKRIKLRKILDYFKPNYVIITCVLISKLHMWVVKGGLQGNNLDYGRAVEDIEKSSTIKKILNNFWRTLEIP